MANGVFTSMSGSSILHRGDLTIDGYKSFFNGGELTLHHEYEVGKNRKPTNMTLRLTALFHRNKKEMRAIKRLLTRGAEVTINTFALKLKSKKLKAKDKLDWDWEKDRSLATCYDIELSGELEEIAVSDTPLTHHKK
jgi:hypothetical protein